MIECVRRSSRNVKHWQSGEMALRWTAAGMLEAEQRFRRIIGYRDLAKLAVAIERDLAQATDRGRLRFGEPEPAVVVARERVYVERGDNGAEVQGRPAGADVDRGV